MNLKLNHKKEFALLDLVAEKLLQREFSISYRKMYEIEFLSASLHNAAEEKEFFLIFEPVETNAAVFLTLLNLLKAASQDTITVIVPSEGEQEILLNVLNMQEIEEVNVLCLSKFSSYPLQVVR